MYVSEENQSGYVIFSLIYAFLLIFHTIVILNLIITNQSIFMPKRIVPKTRVGNIKWHVGLSSHYTGNVRIIFAPSCDF